MWSGYLRVGGLEIGNTARALGYTRTSDCPTYWLQDTDECTTLAAAVGDVDYNYVNIADAPWYDPDIPDTSSRFLGVYVVDMANALDSTREAEITQRLQAGGRIGRIRRATRSIRVRVILTAIGDDAMEYALSWLDAVLSPGACGSHGTACGVTDMEFFSACPPEGDVELVDSYRRFYHDVACTSGPFTVQEFVSSDKRHLGRMVEFTITCENPWMYGVTSSVAVPTLVPTIVQDIAYNLAPYPSAEITDSTVLVSTNYSTNPSLETNATGWTGAVTGAGLSATSGRVTGELAAVGTASYRVVATAAAAGSGGTIRAEQEVAIPDATVRRYSISMWAAAVVITGSPVLGSIQFRAYWRSGSGGATLRTDDLGSVPAAGGAVSVKSIAPPAGATHVLVRAELALTSWANGNVVRLYADALAVTNP